MVRYDEEPTALRDSFRADDLGAEIIAVDQFGEGENLPNNIWIIAEGIKSKLVKVFFGDHRHTFVELFVAKKCVEFLPDSLDREVDDPRLLPGRARAMYEIGHNRTIPALAGQGKPGRGQQGFSVVLLAHLTPQITFLITLFETLSFIYLLFTSGDTDRDFDESAVSQVYVQRNERKAFFSDFPSEFSKLLGVQQKLSLPNGFVRKISGVRVFPDMRAD